MTWWPGLVVLALALVGGLWWARRAAAASAARRGEEGAGAAPGPATADRRLALERRKAEIVTRLRQHSGGAGEGDGDPSWAKERETLELEAAGILRELDALQGAATAADAGPGGAATASFARRRPMLAGFLLGAASMGLVAALFVAAQQEWLANRARESAAAGAMPGGDGEHPPAAAPQGEVAAEIARLRQAIAANSGDLEARRQLAITLLQADQLFEAFNEAQGILEISRQDFDGRMIMGVVRLAMGALDEAASHFETAIQQHPENPAGYLYRGLTYQRAGDAQAAVDEWKRGVEAAGGKHEELEHMIATIERSSAGAGGGGMAGSPDRAGGGMPAEGELPPGHPPLDRAATSAPPLTPEGVAAAPAPVPAPAPTPGAIAVGGDSPGGAYAIRIELGPGLASPPGAVLFAALRPAAGGPPVLVKRLDGLAFPLDLTLTPEDAMMGGALPPSGVLTLRLDRDGNASTKEPDEPAASVPVEINVSARAVLVAGG